MQFAICKCKRAITSGNIPSLLPLLSHEPMSKALLRGERERWRAAQASHGPNWPTQERERKGLFPLAVGDRHHSNHGSKESESLLLKCCVLHGD